MYYQDIPFLIASKDIASAEKIASILHRKSNTYVEVFDPDQIIRIQDSVNYFTCNVFHYSDDDEILNEIIKTSLKKKPISPVFLFSFKEIPIETYRSYIQMGVSDIIVHTNNADGSGFNTLINTMNHRWKIFRYLERERKKIYHATVVTAYHEINQPLTVIMNSIDLFSIEMKQNLIDHVRIRKNLSYILKSVRRIQEILDKMKKVDQPKLKAYTKTVPMISLQDETKDTSKSDSNLNLVQEMKVSTDRDSSQ
jgi:signal transduction histidine kinase